VDIETRRKRQQELMRRMAERKVRTRAQQLYESRGQGDGHALQDWFQAEAEMLEDNRVAPLYRRLRSSEGEAATSAASEDEESLSPAGIH
jgi:Protein of unknown function (DUF2934)